MGTLYDFAISEINKALVNPTDDCLLWTNNIVKGYGIVRHHYASIKVHRLALEIKYNRLLDPNSHAAHSCRNTNCYNPYHLEEKTSLKNNHDMYKDKTSPRHIGLRKNNKSGYKGVNYNKKSRTWQAHIRDGDGSITRYLGSFDTAEHAAQAYDKAAYAAWGYDCYLNFPNKCPIP